MQEQISITGGCKRLFVGWVNKSVQYMNGDSAPMVWRSYMKDLVIVGNGGFAREVEWLVDRINHISPTWNFLGNIDSNKSNQRVIGDDEYILNYKRELYVVIGIGSSSVRRRIYNMYKQNQNIRFANLIDPNVILSDRVMMGDGNIICAGSILTVDIKIGDCNIINLDCTVGHDVIMGDFITINPSVNISGGTIIGSGCNIGTGASIIQNLKIGHDTIVGAGALVNKDLPENCTAVGVPARVIKVH